MPRYNSLSCSESTYSPTILWQNGISLIPYPQDVVFGGEDFLVQDKIVITLDKQAYLPLLISLYNCRKKELTLRSDISYPRNTLLLP